MVQKLETPSGLKTECIKAERPISKPNIEAMKLNPDEIRKINVELLEASAQRGRGDIERLLMAGADINYRDNFGRTPLMWAAEKGNGETCGLLLEKGSNPENRDQYGRTALMVAASNGHAETCGLLLEKGGANVDASDDGSKTALMWAALEGRTGTCKLLIEKGADLAARDKHSRTPLMLAIMVFGNGVENKDTIKLLIESSGKDVINFKNSRNETALGYAKAAGLKGIAGLLREAGAES